MTEARDVRRTIAEVEAVLDSYLGYMEHIATCDGEHPDVTVGGGLALAMIPAVAHYVRLFSPERVDQMTPEQRTGLVRKLEPIVRVKREAAADAAAEREDDTHE